MTKRTDKTDKRGRRKGSRQKGYFFRAGRGWYTKEGTRGKFERLTNEAGQPLKDKTTPEAVVRAAHARHILKQKNRPAPAKQTGSATVRDICIFYLDHAKELDKTRDTTIEMRARSLFDLIHGIAAKWREKPKSEWPSPAAGRVAYGNKPAEELTRGDLLDWCKAHPGWEDGGRRTHLQAVKRVMNFAVKWDKIKVNQIRGMQIPASIARVTYISPVEEKALLAHCPRALQTAIKILIRTGMRPGCEFAKVTTAHVTDDGQRIEIRFAKGESKTNKPRTIRVSDAETAALIRKLVGETVKGEQIFRNAYGRPWTKRALSIGFKRAKDKAVAAGQTFDDDCCLYSCRHTYAKRTLTTLPINISMLAALMGNTAEICQKHYADLTKDNAGVNEWMLRRCTRSMPCWSTVC